MIGLLLITILYFILSLRVSFSGPFQGDSVRHVNIAKQFVDDGYIQPYIKNILVDSTNNKPITYPILFHILLAITYVFLGEVGVKLIPVLCGLLLNLLIFLIVRELTKNDWAGILGILLVLSFHDFFRFSSFVFMESLLAVFCFLSAFYFIKSLNVFKSDKTLINFLTGFFIGAAISTKLPGFFMLAIPILYLLFERRVSSLIPIFLGIFLISAPFLGFQLSSMGTVFDPGFASLVHPNNKLASMIDKQALMEFQNSQHEFIRYSYARTFTGLKDFFYLSSSNMMSLLLIFSIFYLPGSKWKILKKLSFLYTLPLCYLLFYFVVPNLRYYFSYRLFVVFVFILGVVSLFKLVSNNKQVKLLTLFTLLIVLIVLATNVANGWIHQKNRIMYQKSEGGYSSLIEACKWLKDNTPENAIILGTPEPDLAYYSQRPVLWISPYGGSKIPKLFQTKDESVALKICSEYNISYIWIGKYQIRKIVTWPQFIPKNGLVSVIGSFKHFKLVYKNKDILIYKVLYKD